VSFIRKVRVLCKTRLIFPRINGPIVLFPLNEHLSSLDQCKVFGIEILQDTHLLIHGSSSWTSFRFIHVGACHCKFAKFQQQTVVGFNLFKFKWRSITWKLIKSLHSSNTKICGEDLFFFCFQCNAADNFFLHVFVTCKFDYFCLGKPSSKISTRVICSNCVT